MLPHCTIGTKRDIRHSIHFLESVQESEQGVWSEQVQYIEVQNPTTERIITEEKIIEVPVEKIIQVPIDRMVEVEVGWIVIAERVCCRVALPARTSALLPSTFVAPDARDSLAPLQVSLCLSLYPCLSLSVKSPPSHCLVSGGITYGGYGCLAMLPGPAEASAGPGCFRIFQELTVWVKPQVERFVEVIKEVPVESVVYQDRIVEVPVEKVVYQEVPVEKIVYQDRIKEVPVDKIVEVPVDRFVDKIVEVVKEVPVEKVVEKVVYRDKEVFSVGFGMAIGHLNEDDLRMVVQEVVSPCPPLSKSPGLASWFGLLGVPSPISLLSSPPSLFFFLAPLPTLHLPLSHT